MVDCLLGVGTWLRTVLELPKGVLVASLFEVTEQFRCWRFYRYCYSVCVCVCVCVRERERERERERVLIFSM